jgi:hypothetical protein
MTAYEKKGGVSLDIKKFTLRLNDEQMELLERKSKEANMSKNAYLTSILDSQLAEEREDLILQELKEIKELLKESK